MDITPPFTPEEAAALTLALRPAPANVTDGRVRNSV
jgi:hypothetical protein